MKKIFGVLIAILLLTSCDDGNMTLQNFSFTNGLQLCDESTNTYISINSSTKEVLIIKFPTNTILNKENLDTDGNPIPQQINLSNGSIEYRVYSGATPTVATVCSGVDNGTINITERWLGSGTVTIVSTKVTDSGTANISYLHAVTLDDVSFTKGNETIRVLDNYLGETTTTTGFSFDFTESGTSISTLSDCTDGRLFLNIGSKALLISLPSGTFTNETREQQFQTDDTHQVRMRVYNGTGINENVVCNGALSPILEQEWSTTNNSGTIKIFSSESADIAGRYLHKIYLYNGTRFFNLSGSGEFFRPDDNDTDPSSNVGRYYIGTYAP